MLRSVLIANRGEIARRILRTARRLGVRTIAVHSDADRHAPYVREADQSVAIGGAAARDSYLDAAKILAAARLSGAEAIHPGYGFLSENAEFAAAVQSAGLVWIGAPPAAIRAMGRKDAAKALMMRAGVPVTPGYLGEDQAPPALRAAADAIGYPVLIKAVAGGGGKGMRRIESASDFEAALAACRREATAAFGDERVLIERYIGSPRHIEVQVFGDTHGRIVHLFERDCSVQRRHQKVIEEAPAPGMDEATRALLCAAAVRAAAAVQYVGAGTIEFIADASEGLRADRIWFMEMNTRLQVEHPVTEAITGLDLVEWQLRVAAGEALPCRQEEIAFRGAAVEARLYAENPTTGFLPSTGPLRHFYLPEWIRSDSGVEPGGEMTGYYDPLMAKLIVHAPNREAAVRELERACAAVRVWPVHSNAAFLARLAAHPAFVAGAVDTSFIERHAAMLIPPPEPEEAVVQAAADALLRAASAAASQGPGGPGGPADDPWTALVGFRVNAPEARRVAVAIGGRTYLAEVPATQSTPETRGVTATIDGDQVLFLAGAAWRFGVPISTRAAADDAVSDGALRSPMPGRVVKVAVRNGQSVARGTLLIVIEAMKMEHALLAPFDGAVEELRVAEGDQVAENLLLARVARSDGPVPAPVIAAS
jgi:3-methylcrotonyl-CoA carboxylase alpha subunit